MTSDRANRTEDLTGQEVLERLAGTFEGTAVRIRGLLDDDDETVDDAVALDAIEVLIDELADDAAEARLSIARRRIAFSKPIELGAVVARNVKGMREASGWTQEEIAHSMRRLGFNSWRRITVAEAESGKRKMQLEELIGYAILFGTTVGDILMNYKPEEALVVNDHLIVTPPEAAQLITRDDDYFMGASPTNEVQAKLAGVIYSDGVDDWRPIANEHGGDEEAKSVARIYGSLVRGFESSLGLGSKIFTPGLYKTLSWMARDITGVSAQHDWPIDDRFLGLVYNSAMMVADSIDDWPMDDIELDVGQMHDNLMGLIFEPREDPTRDPPEA